MNKVVKFLILILLVGLVSMDASFAQKAKKKKKATKKTTKVVKKTKTVKTVAEPVVPAEPEARHFPLDSADYSDSTGYNPLSVRPVHKSDIMFRMRIWRNLQLKEKCNTPLFTKGFEVTRFILDAYRAGQLIAFVNDSLILEKTRSKVEETLAEIDPQDAANNRNFRPEELNFIEIKEDLLFDKQRSQMVYDIQAINLFVPANTGVKTFDVPIASFRYRDLEKAWNKNSQAKWKNLYNNAEDRKLSDAFRIRLFCSRITKLLKDNPRGDAIDGLARFSSGGVRQQLIASQQYEYDLVNTESELYEN